MDDLLALLWPLGATLCIGTAFGILIVFVFVVATGATAELVLFVLRKRRLSPAGFIIGIVSAPMFYGLGLILLDALINILTTVWS